MILGCTIVAANYLGVARVLARSFVRHHPASRFVVLVIDEPDPDVEEPFEVWTLDRLDEPAESLRTMAGTYSVMEFATAVKPWLLDALLDVHDGPVCYLDPDCEVFAPIDDVVAPALDVGIVLTPHVCSPMPRDGHLPDEASILSAGVYNLGFIAVGPRARTSGFLKFWQERLRRDAIVDPGAMLFTDQRWVDFAVLFPHEVVEDRGCNVAYWNLWERPLAVRDDGTVTAAGVPLRFFHFSGFDPSRPHLLSAHQGDRPRVRVPDDPVLTTLCAEYAASCREAGHDRARRAPYGWAATAAGTTLTHAMRRAYRAGVMEAEAAGRDAPPGPFAPDGGRAFTRWLCAPARPGGVSWLLYGRWLHEASLQARFHEPLGAHAADYAHWARHEGATDRVAPLWLWRAATVQPGIAPDRPIVAASPSPERQGLNLFGYLGAGASIGHVARSLLDAAGIAGLSLDVAALASGHGHQRPEVRDTRRPRWTHDVNVLCVNADQTPHVVHRLGRDAFAGRRTAGLWFWEAPRFAEDATEAMDLLDEIWVPSRYVADAVRAAGRQPRLVTLGVAAPGRATIRSRVDLDLPDGFVVLCCLDWTSVAERKNPWGTLEAYRRAFGPDDGATLVFKTTNADLAWGDVDRLRSAIGDRPDVRILDGHRTRTELTALYQLVDCVISLHRSEGFGMFLAEAMRCGVPTIATAHGGNLDFMDDDVAHLVPAELVPIADDVVPYGGLGVWADPDLDAAAAALRQICDDPIAAAQRAARARAHLTATHDVDVAARSLAAAVAALRASGGDRS